MRSDWRVLLAALLGVGPALALSLWPAPPPLDHHNHAAQGDHSPAALKRRATTVPPATAGAAAWDRRLPEWNGLGRGLEVGPGRAYRTLTEALAVAGDGDQIILFGGRHPGPVRLDRRVWIEGRQEAAIEGDGRGTVIMVTSPGARVTGLAVSRGGDSLSSEDSGVFIEGAPGAVVAGCDLSSVQFGVVAKASPGAWIAGNTVRGRAGDLSLNGDGIRVWYSDGSKVVANTVIRTREILIEASQDVQVESNAIIDGRQGLHLMRAPGAVATGNFLAGNSTGIYVMYGAGTRLTGNRAENNRGPSGYGLGLKEADGVQAEDNWLIGNRVGIYLDNSPLDQNRANVVADNLVAFNDIGLAITPATRGNLFSNNDFLENHQQVGVNGGGRLDGNAWTVRGRGNYWSDYAGYDAGSDGTGDIPHAPIKVFEGWMDRVPDLRWFWFTPAASAVDLAARAFPLADPEPILTDERPNTTPAGRRNSLWSN